MTKKRECHQMKETEHIDSWTNKIYKNSLLNVVPEIELHILIVESTSRQEENIAICYAHALIMYFFLYIELSAAFFW